MRLLVTTEIRFGIVCPQRQLTSVRRSPRGYLPEEWRTNGSRNCFGKAMQRCSKSTRK